MRRPWARAARLPRARDAGWSRAWRAGRLLAWPARRPRVGQPARLRPADAIGEALTAIVASPARALLAGLGTLLGVAWFVVALGLAATASGQVTTAFAGRLATQVTVRPARPGPSPPAYPYPPDVQRRLDALRGVVAAGVYWRVRLAGPVVVSAQPAGPAALPGTSAAHQAAAGPGQVVIAASPGFLAAAGVRISQGRAFGAWAQARSVPACVLGSAAARALGVTGIRGSPAVFIEHERCTVTGIFDHAIRRPALLRAVLLPASAAIALWGPPGQRAGTTPTVLIQTRPGAAPQVGRQAADAISPARPRQFTVIVPVRPQRLRDQVARTLSGLFVTLGWVSLAIGAASIAVISWLSVRERRGEYALRRAVGARRGHVLAHVITETAIIGLAGGLAGASLGVALVVLIARAAHWVPVIAPLTALLAPLAGAAAGVAAGLIPGIGAARVQPGRALGRP